MDRVTATPREVDELASPLEPTALSAAWRYRWLVLFVVIVFAAAGVLLALARPPEFIATASLVVQDPRLAGFTEEIRQDPERYVANQVAILTSAAVAQRAAELATEQLPTAGLTARDFLDNTEIGAQQESDLIVIRFFAADNPTTAQVGANALALAYQDVRRQEALSSAAAALERVDLSLERIDEELPQLAGRIEDVRGASETRQQLDQQFEEAMARLVELQAQRQELSPAEEGELAAIRAALSDLEQQFQTLETVTGLEEQRNPDLRALLEEQSSAIERRAELRARRDQIVVDAELVGGGVALFSPAQSSTASRGAALRTAAVAVVFGLLAGLALAYFLALRRRVFADRVEPELLLGAPLLAEIPNFREEGVASPVPVRVAPASASAEAFRFAAASLEIRMNRAKAKILVLVSGVLGEGKSTVLANTAMAAARQGSRVLAVDADFGNQNLTELLLGTTVADVGLTEAVADQVPLGRALQRVPVTEGASLSLLSRGRQPVVAPEFFRSEATARLFEMLRDEFDLVLVDTPPLLQVAYASTLVGYAEAVAVVVEHGSPVSHLEEVIDRLWFIGTPVAGYIYNRAPLRPRMTRTEGSLADVLGVGVRPERQQVRR
jgi:Mrp family chromosome partitioning ATPase/capsular polysaccharide biosynthesis protein